MALEKLVNDEIRKPVIHMFTIEGDFD